MKYQIQKERLQLMSPAVNVCAAATWNAPIDTEALARSIQYAVRQNEILNCRAEILTDGTAYLVKQEAERPISLAPFTGSAEDLILDQDRQPFAIEEGETVRFFYGGDAQKPTLVAIAHHLVCDGGSIIKLMRDILRAVNGQDVAYAKIKLLTREDLPKHPGLNLFLRMMMKRTNAKWSANGKTFDFSESRRMFDAYAESHPTYIKTCTLRAERVQRLLEWSRANGLTLNSLILTAFASTMQKGEGIGVPVDVYKGSSEGIGNYAIATSIRATYDDKLSFTENAKRTHRAVRKKLDDPAGLYFLYEFMGALNPTLTDSIYFHAYGGYDNPITKSLCDMCGYADAPKGITVTNIKEIDTKDDPAWAHRFETLTFIPPYIPNVRSVIGVSTYKGETTFCLRTTVKAKNAEEEARFMRAMELLNML